MNPMVVTTWLTPRYDIIVQIKGDKTLLFHGWEVCIKKDSAQGRLILFSEGCAFKTEGKVFLNMDQPALGNNINFFAIIYECELLKNIH